VGRTTDPVAQIEGPAGPTEVPADRADRIAVPVIPDTGRAVPAVIRAAPIVGPEVGPVEMTTAAITGGIPRHPRRPISDGVGSTRVAGITSRSTTTATG
jgi:hypothetical protein